jgi:hypothetical protein
MTDSLELQTFCERFCYLIALAAYLLWEALWVRSSPPLPLLGVQKK